MIILDTCVLSEAIKPEPAAQVLNWIASLPEQRVFLSVISIGELEQSIKLLRPDSTQQALRIWFEQLQERFRGKILPIDTETTRIWGKLSARLQQANSSVSVIDGLQAALALRHSALFATCDIEALSVTGVELVNPWDN